MIKRILLCLLAVFAFTGAIVAPSPKTYGPSVDTGWTVLVPSGGDDHAALQAAFNASATTPVFLKAGAYISCSPLTVPNNAKIYGVEINAWAIFQGVPNFPTDYIFCPNSAPFLSTFTSGQAFITLPASGSNRALNGFSVVGFFNGTGGTDLGVDCFQIVDGGSYEPYDKLTGVYGYNCHNGLTLTATNPSSHIEGIEVYDSGFNGNANYNIYTTGSGGAFISDWKIIRTSTAFGALGEVYMNNTSGFQMLDSRLEDSGGPAVTINGGCCQVYSGNLFDRNTESFNITNNNNLYIGANYMNTYGSEPQNIEFAGTNYYINIAVNETLSGSPNYIYKIDSGGSLVGGQITDSPGSGALGLYADTYTENIIAPMIVGQYLDRGAFINLTLSSTTFSAPDMSAGKNFLIALTNSCSPCTVPVPSTSPLPIGQHGYFAIVQSPSGGATLSWGPLYSGWTTPTLSTIPEAIDYVEYVVQQNGVSLRPQAPAQNSAGTNTFTGGPGMTSGWSTSHSTFANAVGGCVDPIGGSACSTITESLDTSPTIQIHAIGQTQSLSGPATFSEFVNAGTPHQSGVVTATFTSSGNSMIVSGVTSGAVVQGSKIACSCAANGLYIVGFNSGTGGTGTYYTSVGETVASPTTVTLTDPRFLSLSVIDGSFANSVAVGIDPNTGLLVDPKIGYPSATGRVTGTGILYGAYVVPVPGTTWYYVSMTYGGVTAAFEDNTLGITNQNTSGPDWTDYLGDGGGFVEVYGPTLVSGVTPATGKWTFPGAVTMPSLTSGSAANALCQDSSHNLITCSNSSPLAANNTWTAGQAVTPVALTDGSTIATNAALSNGFTLTVAGNSHTLSNPTGIIAGQHLEWQVTWSGTISGFAVGSNFKFPGGTPPAWSEGVSGDVDVISCWATTTSRLNCTALIAVQ